MPRDPIWHGDRQYNLANDAVLSCEAGGKPNRSYRLWDLQVTYVLRGKIHDGYIIGFALRPRHRWGPQPCGHHLGTPIKFSPRGIIGKNWEFAVWKWIFAFSIIFEHHRLSALLRYAHISGTRGPEKSQHSGKRTHDVGALRTDFKINLPGRQLLLQWIQLQHHSRKYISSCWGWYSK